MTKNKKKLAKFERNNKEIMRNINHIFFFLFPKKENPKEIRLNIGNIENQWSPW